MAAPTTTTKNQPAPLGVQAFWLTASRLVAAAMSIFLPILLVRLLPQTEYGVLKEAFLFVSTVAGVAMFGVGMSAYYYMPRHPERGGQIALNILVYNFIAGWIPLLIVVLYPGILRSLFRTDALRPLAVLLGFMILFTLTSSLLEQIPTAMQDVRHSTMFIVGLQMTRAILLGAAALWFRSVKSIVVAVLLTQMLALFVLFWYLDERFPRFWRHFDWEFFKEQLAYALPYGAIGMLWVIQKDLDNYFVSASLGPKDYAIYAVGWVDVPLVTLALDSVVSVMIVRISSLQKQDRKADIRYVTAAATNRLAAIQFPLFAMLFVASRDLIVLLYTSAYEPSANIFRISILLLPGSVFLLDPIVRTYQELRNFVLTTRALFFVALFIVLFPVVRHFGMIGAAIAAVAAQITERTFIACKAASVVEASWEDFKLFHDLFKVIAASTVAGVLAYTVRNLISPRLLVLRIIAVGLCATAVYLPAVILFRLPGWENLSKEKIWSVAQMAWARVTNSSWR